MKEEIRRDVEGEKMCRELNIGAREIKFLILPKNKYDDYL